MKHHTIKIPVHSMIDLITNSSTEIFVNCEGSLEPAKALLGELLKMEHSYKDVDEIFSFSLQVESDHLIDVLSENLEDLDEEAFKLLNLENLDYSEAYESVEKYVEDINKGTIKRPDYFDDIMDDYEINVDTNLVIKSKDPKYDHFLGLLETFLYSPDYQEGYR